MAKKINNHEMAEEFCLSAPYKTDMVYCTEYDLFYLWDNYYYREIIPREMEKTVHRFLKDRFGNQQITMSIIHDVINQIKIDIYRETKTGDQYYIAFQDKYFNLRTFKEEVTSKDKVAIHSIPYNYSDTKMEIPIFHNFLNTSLVEKGEINTDPQLITFVHEMFGYFITPNMKGNGAFFLIGDGANGKSVMADILLAMVGERYCSSMSIQELTTKQFSLPELIGKKINISNEEESKYMRSDKFKALITGDMVSAERKFGETFKFRPTTKFLFASNDTPTFDSINHGLMRRMKFVPFYRRFEEDEQDKFLTETIIQNELPGIIGWAIEGAKKFQENKYKFHTPKASMFELNAFQEEISSSIMFLRQNFVIGQGYFTSNDDIYVMYSMWCKRNGKKPVNSVRFGKEITKNIVGLSTLRSNRKYGKNVKIRDDSDVGKYIGEDSYEEQESNLFDNQEHPDRDTQEEEYDE